MSVESTLNGPDFSLLPPNHQTVSHHSQSRSIGKLNPPEDLFIPKGELSSSVREGRQDGWRPPSHDDIHF